MTPLQKLTRLAQIDRQLIAIDPQRQCEVRNRLEAERTVIMRGIGHPPPDLANNADPADWAYAIGETFPGLTQEELFPWLDTFATAVYDKGRENGTREALNHINAGTQGLIDALRAIRDDAKGGQIRAMPMLYQGGEVALDEFIIRTLKVAGLT